MDTYILYLGLIIILIVFVPAMYTALDFIREVDKGYKELKEENRKARL